jgi:ribosome-binding protein aMBF1 (putative translation factor)
MSAAIRLLDQTDDTVTLARADFEELLRALEDAEDLAEVEAHRAHERRVGWEAARADYLTGEEADRLLAGESPVRVWREKRGLSQRALAERAGVSPSYLAEIETRVKPGSAEALKRLAEGLDVSMDGLMPVQVAE